MKYKQSFLRLNFSEKDEIIVYTDSGVYEGLFIEVTEDDLVIFDLSLQDYRRIELFDVGEVIRKD